MHIFDSKKIRVGFWRKSQEKFIFVQILSFVREFSTRVWSKRQFLGGGGVHGGADFFWSHVGYRSPTGYRGLV